MRSPGRVARVGIAVVAAALGTSCASAPPAAPAPAAASPAPDPDALRIAAANDAFGQGREAALSGDFTCARFYFSRAIDEVRPESGPAPTGSLLAYSQELYEGIQRYEALAGATEEAGTSHGGVSPELEAEIESPEASPEAIATAREAVASEVVVSDIPIAVNDSVLRVIAAFQSDALRPKISAGLSRSGRYVPMIHRVFAEEGLPTDLAMIALIESAFLPHARSPKSAHGIWQFMPRTGRQYGLKSNGVVDERSDPEKATRAAARYLAYLHEIFDDWYLAMAAYNAGEGKIMRAMQRTGARDFWELASTNAIRRQTQNYVPAFLASVLISKSPGHYGFDYELEPELAYETILLDRPVNLQQVAGGAAIPLDDLTALNPELRSLVTPYQPEGYELKIPPGMRETVLLAYAAAPTQKPPAFKTYVARKGDTLPRIARKYGVSVSALAAANSLSTRSRLARGQEVMVPEKVASARTAKPKTAGKAKRPKTETANASSAKIASTPKSYRVKSGDTLYRIAVRHGVSVAEILAVNGLPGSGGSIKPGDRLQIPPSGK
jgi:peptidoglycan lytic transglycosylase D